MAKARRNRGVERLVAQKAERMAHDAYRAGKVDRQTHFLVQMPDLWYYLDSVTPRAFEQARTSRIPKRIIKGANPWPTVRDNLSDFRSPGREKVLVLNVLDGKTYGPFSFAKIKKLAVAKNNPYTPSFGTPHPTPISAAQLAIIEIEDTDGSKWYASEDGVTDKRAHALRMPRNVANIQADMLSMQYDSPTKVLVVGRAKKNTGSRTKPMLSWMVNIEGPRGSIDVFDVTAKTREEAKKCVREEGVPIGRKKSETALRFGKREVTYGMGRKGYSVIISGPDGPVRFNPRAHSNGSVKCSSCRGTGYAGPHGDTCQRCEGSGWQSLEQCDICRKTVRGGTIQTRHGDWACVPCYDEEEGVRRDRFGYRVRNNPLPLAPVAIYVAKKIVEHGGRALWQHVMGLSVSERAAWLEKNSAWVLGPSMLFDPVGPFKSRRKETRKKAFLALAGALGEPRVRKALETGGDVISMGLNNPAKGWDDVAIEIGLKIIMKLGPATWKKVKGMDVQTRAEWLDASAKWLGGTGGWALRKVGNVLPFKTKRAAGRKKAFLALSKVLGSPEVQQAVEMAATEATKKPTKKPTKKNPKKKCKKKKLRKIPRHGPELAVILKQRRAGAHSGKKGKKGYTRRGKHQARGNPTCVRCEGAGYIPAFSHIDGGTCFSCKGTGR